VKNKLRFHIAFWLAYVIYDTALEFAWMRSSYAHYTDWHRLWVSVHAVFAMLPPKMIFTYFVLFVTIDRGLMKNRKIIYLVLEMIPALLLCIIMHRLIVHYYLRYYVYYEAPWVDQLFGATQLISGFITVGFTTACAVAMKFLRMHWISKEREKSLVKEKLEAELKFLRTQTNPHFLFNTLNNIYALARKKSDHTADVVMKLSKLLRFMLYESRKERIPLSDEIRMIEDYLELEKIRYNERLKITFLKDIDDPSQQVAPLLLLPFIENAFKHGASETRFDSYILINTKLQKGFLQFDIENSKEVNGDTSVTENIGLSNVRRQLELMYNDYTLQIMNQEKHFAVHLTIYLNNDAKI